MGSRLSGIDGAYNELVSEPHSERDEESEEVERRDLRDPQVSNELSEVVLRVEERTDLR